MVLVFVINIVFYLDGVHLPKDLSLVIFSFGLHRRPDLYPDPDKFDPERFTNNKVMPPYTYLPFSAGSRNCIGMILDTVLDFRI